MSLENFPSIKSPRYPLERLPEWGVEIHSTMGGTEQRIQTRSKIYTKIRVTWQFLTDADKVTLAGFFSDRQGVFEEFYLTDFIDGTTVYRARFDTQEISFRYFVNSFWQNLSLTFVLLEEEVLP